MMTSENLLTKWNTLPEAGGHTRIDATHPLDMYVGYEEGQKSLLLISSNEQSLIPSSKSILAGIGKRLDGKWAITLRLVRSEQEEVFAHLCWDLIESSRSQREDAKGVEFVLRRYRRWHRLLERQASGLLSEEARRGLIGELLFLQRVLVGGMPELLAVNGWIGPDGSDRDFVYSGGWHEVKVAGVAASAVSISSLNQLDAPPPGELVVFFLDRTAPEDNAGFTLNGKVSEVRSALTRVPEALETFDSKLLDFGYIAQGEYDKETYRLGGVRRYTIDGSFPRLVSTTVPPQITSATYSIDLSAIESWRAE